MKKLVCLSLVCALTFSGCGSLSKKKKDKAAVTKKDEKPKTPPQESSDVDFQAFLGRLRKAVQARDMQTIAGMMTPDFAYAMGATPEQDKKGGGVFQYWDEKGLWPELDGILQEKFVTKGDFMVAPLQFAVTPAQYEGYRVGIRRVNGSWKFVYFVNGS
ncbi:MAG: hypothetical protein ACR2NX_01115 [Chthoniobacterales bacterium]